MSHYLQDILRFVSALNIILAFASYFVWIAGWYILLQLTRLNFIKLIIAGDICFIFAWAVAYRSHFISIPVHPSETYLAAMLTIREILHFIGVILTLVGACYGLRYLQKKWAEKGLPGEQ